MSNRIDHDYVPLPLLQPLSIPEKQKEDKPVPDPVTSTTKKDESSFRGNSARFQIEKKAIAHDGKTSEQAAKATDQKIEEAVDAQKNLDQLETDTPNQNSQASSPELQTQREVVDQKLVEVKTAVEDELRTVAHENGDSHQAITRGAREIIERSPENKTFQVLIAEAEQNVHADKAKQTIETAYSNKGAGEAAQVLREQTDQVKPDTAARIISENKSTIDEIVNELGSGAKSVNDEGARVSKTQSGPVTSNNTDLKQTARTNGFNSTLSNLGAAASKAAQAANGKEIVAQTARTIVDQIEQHGVDQFSAALGKTIAKGGGANLAIEVASQLQADGKLDEAVNILQNVKNGVDELKDNLKNSLTNYAHSSAEIEQLVQTADPPMDDIQLHSALNDFKKAHPALEQKFEALDKLSSYVVRTMQTLDELPANLRALGHDADVLLRAVEDLLIDKNVQKAVMTMPQAINEFKKLLELETQGKLTFLSKLPETAERARDKEGFLEKMSKILFKATIDSAIEARLSGNTDKANGIIDNLRKYGAVLQADQTKLDAAVQKLKFLLTVPANQVQAELKRFNLELNDLSIPFSNTLLIGNLFRGAAALLSMPKTVDSLKQISNPLCRTCPDRFGQTCETFDKVVCRLFQQQKHYPRLAYSGF